MAIADAKAEAANTTWRRERKPVDPRAERKQAVFFGVLGVVNVAVQPYVPLRVLWGLLGIWALVFGLRAHAKVRSTA